MHDAQVHRQLMKSLESCRATVVFLHSCYNFCSHVLNTCSFLMSDSGSSAYRALSMCNDKTQRDEFGG